MARQTVKSGMHVIISSCFHKTCYAEFRCNGCKPDVKKGVIKWVDGRAGIRVTARESRVSTDTVIKELKKEALIEYVDKDCLETHKNSTIRIEADEMWSFYHGKKHQIRLRRAVGHETGEVIAFCFGTREHNQLDKLLELLEPLNPGNT